MTGDSATIARIETTLKGIGSELEKIDRRLGEMDARLHKVELATASRIPIGVITGIGTFVIGSVLFLLTLVDRGA